MFTACPDPGGMEEAERGFKEEEEAEEARAVEVVEVVVEVVEGEIKEEPRLALKINQRSTFLLSTRSNIWSPDPSLPLETALTIAQ